MKQQPWLISVEYFNVTRWPGRPQLERSGPSRRIFKSKDAPWRYLVQAKFQYEEFCKGNRSISSADEITAILWAVQIPVGEMTDEEMDLLS